MKVLRHSKLVALMLLITILLVACGGTTNTTTQQGTTMNTASQDSTYNGNSMNNQNDNGMMYATPTANTDMMGGISITPDMGGNTNAYVHTGKATINGNQVNVLMTNKGFAVYYYMPDTMLKATCTGQCAQDWPPVLAPQGMMTISSSMTLPKQLSVHQTPNGAQVFYDGHALYTYAADKQPNVATGRGQDMQWYLVGFLL